MPAIVPGAAGKASGILLFLCPIVFDGTEPAVHPLATVPHLPRGLLPAGPGRAAPPHACLLVAQPLTGFMPSQHPSRSLRCNRLGSNCQSSSPGLHHEASCHTAD